MPLKPKDLFVGEWLNDRNLQSMDSVDGSGECLQNGDVKDGKTSHLQLHWFVHSMQSFQMDAQLKAVYSH
ncbi:hypothetical protein D3C73_856560 [compost metagenome]